MKGSTIQVIDQHRYEFTELGPREAFPIYLWLVALVGATGKDAAGAIKSWKDIRGIADLFNAANVDMAKMIGALGQALGRLNDPVIVGHVDVLLGAVLLKGTPLSLDHVNFQGKMVHLTKVLIQSVKVNFSEVFHSSGDLVDGGAAPSTASKSGPQT